MKKSIYVIYTGGTIGMRESAAGFVPKANFLSPYLETLSELRHPQMPDFTMHEYHPLVDSACMTPSHWQRIADDIQQHYHQFDGFVVLHGTDTMAYTASALSFILQGLQKPVIITGSQLPLSQLRSDGRQNFLNALYIAAHYPIAEVSLFFNHKLFRGNRATKVHATSFDAFSSPNYPLLLKAGIEIQAGVGKVRYEKAPITQPLSCAVMSHQPIGIISWYPGIDIRILDNIVHQPLKALILQTYGVGNASSDDLMIAQLKTACERGIILVNTSQCLHGRVDMTGYATGSILAEGGAISGSDMTLEATLTKLHFLLSQDLTPSAIRQQMQKNLRGELTIKSGALE